MGSKIESARPPGKTTIDPGVLLSIARLTALSVAGVSRMGEVPGSLRRIFKRDNDQGIRIAIADGIVDVEVHVVLEANTDIRAVSRTIQTEIARAVSEMVGMEVGHIDVHIDDIDYFAAEAGSENEG
jgi:uncharacterized alkaline shock family protein YloU